MEIIPLGLFLSFLFVGSIFAFSKSVILSGAALSTVSSRLSVFVPIVLSIIIFNELPNLYQTIGLVFTAATIILFYFSVRNPNNTIFEKEKFLYLIAVLIGIGTADFFMKVFQVNWESSAKPWFLFWIFGFSFLITFLLSIKERKNIDRSALLLGILMGVPNLFSSYFLIGALKSYPAVFVYPFVNMSIIVLTAFIVKFIWNEQWNFYSKLALAAGIVAIILLSLK
jgi:drug/metabolite transporter (DMT)-like permease